MDFTNGPPDSGDVARRFLDRYREVVGEPADPLAAVDELFAAFAQAKAFAADFQRTFIAERERRSELEQTLDALEAAHAATERSERRYRALAYNASDTVTILDANFCVVEASPSLERGWGYTLAELSGHPLTALVHEHDETGVRAALVGITGRAGAHVGAEFRLLDAGGEWRHIDCMITNLLDDDAVGGIVVNSRDVTEKRELEERLTHQAFHDALTDLPNRRLFLDRLEHALAAARRRRTGVGLLFIDVDRFKAMNDTYGHQTGDSVLAAIAGRLAVGCAGGNDTLARIGGDEFAIVLEDVSTAAEVELAAARITGSMAIPLTVGSRAIDVSVSIGIGMSVGGETPAADTVRAADIALNEAKRAGHGQAVRFDERLDALWSERLAVEADLRGAVERGELRNLYQPLVDLPTGRITGAEALVRWEHPVRGLVSPSQFIPIAEEAGYIPLLGRWVLAEACRRAAQWNAREGASPFLMSVNVSPLELRSREFVGQVASTLERYSLDPANLQLEITESTLMEEGPIALARVEELKRLGVRIAIDDFGTGYSSLAYLSRLPVDVLKVDRAFVSEMVEDSRAGAIVRAVTELARGLGIEITAEGIESEAQRRALNACGANHAQGFLFSRPVTAELIDEILERDAGIDHRAA